MIVAIIPARSGSKRIKNKNIKSFYNKPIIYYAIKAATDSKLFNKIIVSTDSKKIGSIAKKFGAEFTFVRPKNLSGDRVGTRKVILHAMDWIEKKYEKPKFICCIYPTAVLLSPVDLKKSYQIIKSKKWNYIFSATKNSYPIERAFNLTDDKGVRMIKKKNFLKRSQDFKDSFHDAGQFCWGSYRGWREQRIIFDKSSSVYLIPFLRSHDIDNIDDWEIVKKLYKYKNK